MAHFAKIGLNNVVEQVIVVHNNELLNDNGIEVEQRGVDFCKSLFGGTWVQTSYNENFRGCFAGKGYTYDFEKDVFIPPKPFVSWTLNKNTCRWEAPVPMPEGGGYVWDENAVAWVETSNV